MMGATAVHIDRGAAAKLLREGEHTLDLSGVF